MHLKSWVHLKSLVDLKSLVHPKSGLHSNPISSEHQQTYLVWIEIFLISSHQTSRSCGTHGA